MQKSVDELKVHLMETNEDFRRLATQHAEYKKLVEALELGAIGVQVGTAFAFCRESGMRPDYKQSIIAKVRRGEASVFTDPLSSPTGFPFKAAQLEGTSSDPEVYKGRKRICDVGVLRESYLTPEGKIAQRCPSEPENLYVAKGGVFEDTVGRKCVCNGLPTTAGLGQVSAIGRKEMPIVTAGDDAREVSFWLRPDGSAVQPGTASGAYGSGGYNQAQVLRACQDAVVARVNQAGYQNGQTRPHRGRLCVW